MPAILALIASHSCGERSRAKSDPSAGRSANFATDFGSLYTCVGCKPREPRPHLDVQVKLESRALFVEIIAIASAMGWAGDSILVRFGLRKSNIFAAMLVSYAVSVAFLQVLHVFLAFFEAPSFFLGYLAFFDAPFDTLILLFLPLIDARRGLRERVYRHCSPPAARSAPNVFLQLCVINAVAGSSGSFGCPASSCFSM